MEVIVINKVKKERVEWIDICKFLGIFAIYLGHFSEKAGLSYLFVFSYHVYLFFFISGCLSNCDSETNFFKFVWKKIKTLLIPFYAFGLLSIVIEVLKYNFDLHVVLSLLILLFKGAIKNTFFAYTLWFLTCLFVMEILFKLLKKINYKSIIIFICFIFYLAFEYFVETELIVFPHILYNIDIAFHLIIYYAMGYVLFPYIKKLFTFKTVKSKILFIILFIISFIVSAFQFEHIDIITKIVGNNFYLKPFVSFTRIMILIYFNFSVARLLSGVEFFSNIGKETLYLCGNECIFKYVFSLLLMILGINIELKDPLMTIIYNFIIIVFSVKVFIPIEKYMVNVLKKNAGELLKSN